MIWCFHQIGLLNYINCSNNLQYQQIMEPLSPQKYFFKGPISALCFQQQEGGQLKLLVGEGPTLTVYDTHTREIIQEQVLFPLHLKITDITLSQGMVIVQTEKCLKVLDSQGYSVLYELMKESVDKIIHSQLVEEDTLISITAHNFVEKWKLGSPNKMLSRQFCEEECILYSGDFNSNTNMVAAGTVFRSVLIWSFQQGSEQPAQVSYKLEGHLGVIFDVKFLRDDLIASVSDDRSLRLWRINLQEKSQYQQIGEYFGHRSRIWRLKELGFGSLLATVSEDTTCKLWQLPESEQKISVNKSIETLKGHLGRNIRALACIEGIVATGGDDGAIKIWNVKDILSKKTLKQTEADANVTQISIPKLNGEGDANQIRCVEVITLDSEEQEPLCIVGTGKGSIYAVQVISGEQVIAPRCLYQDQSGVEKDGIILDIAYSKTTIVIYGQSISLILAAIGNGDVIALSLRHSNSSYHSTTLVRFQNLSSIKILNIFITRTTLVSENEIHLEFLSANGKAELIKRKIIYTLEQNGDQFKETATMIGDQVLKVNQKTQFICGTLIESLGIFVVGDTKGNNNIIRIQILISKYGTYANQDDPTIIMWGERKPPCEEGSVAVAARAFAPSQHILHCWALCPAPRPPPSPEVRLLAIGNEFLLHAGRSCLRKIFMPASPLQEGGQRVQTSDHLSSSHQASERGCPHAVSGRTPSRYQHRSALPRNHQQHNRDSIRGRQRCASSAYFIGTACSRDQ